MKDNENIEIVITFKYKDKKYAKAVNFGEKNFKYSYYEVASDNELKEVTDKELLEYFKKTKETHSKRIY